MKIQLYIIKIITDTNFQSKVLRIGTLLTEMGRISKTEVRGDPFHFLDRSQVKFRTVFDEILEPCDLHKEIPTKTCTFHPHSQGREVSDIVNLFYVHIGYVYLPSESVPPVTRIMTHYDLNVLVSFYNSGLIPKFISGECPFTT